MSAKLKAAAIKWLSKNGWHIGVEGAKRAKELRKAKKEKDRVRFSTETRKPMERDQ